MFRTALSYSVSALARATSSVPRVVIGSQDDIKRKALETLQSFLRKETGFASENTEEQIRTMVVGMKNFAKGSKEYNDLGELVSWLARSSRFEAAVIGAMRKEGVAEDNVHAINILSKFKNPFPEETNNKNCQISAGLRKVSKISR